jgi:hypothetical protein
MGISNDTVLLVGQRVEINSRNSEDLDDIQDCHTRYIIENANTVQSMTSPLEFFVVSDYYDGGWEATNMFIGRAISNGDHTWKDVTTIDLNKQLDEINEAKSLCKDLGPLVEGLTLYIPEGDVWYDTENPELNRITFKTAHDQIRLISTSNIH